MTGSRLHVCVCVCVCACVWVCVCVCMGGVCVCRDSRQEGTEGLDRELGN
jgi:hypothetical protein